MLWQPRGLNQTGQHWRRPQTAAAGSGPDTVSGLWQWVKADAGTFTDSAMTTPATADNDPVGGWQDQSGGGRHWTQGTAGDRPTLKTNILNGLPIIRGDGGATGNFFTGPDPSALTAGEVFIVVTVTADPASSFEHTYMWQIGAGTLASHYPDTSGNIHESWGSTTRHTVNPTPSLVAFRLYNVSSQSGEFTSRLDGTQIYTNATNTVGFSSTTRLFNSTLGGADMFLGDIAELIIYDNVLSGGDRDVVEAYIASKYALTIA